MKLDLPDQHAVLEIARQLPTLEARLTYLDHVYGQDAARRARILEQLGSGDGSPPRTARQIPVEQTIDATPSGDQEGETIGRYKLLQRIGEGGFGVVHMAEQHEPVRRKVALKVIKPGMDTKEVIARFEVERQALAMMDHPNIAKVLDAGTTATGRPFFVMELVRGIPVTAYCDEQRLTTQNRLMLFVKVCQAVQHAHQKGIIHRDLKPSNVLITEHDGTPVPKVIDFGVAKAINQRLTERTVFTRFQQMVGTPIYMSPEQAQLSGLDVDTRTDIYSLGVLLYELLTGTTPFDKQRFSQSAFDEIRRIIREEDPPKPSTRLSTLGGAEGEIAGRRRTEIKRLRQVMRGELDWVVMKALEKERGRRYETADAFASDVQRYLNNEAVRACPPSIAYQTRKFCRRHRGAVAASAALLLLLCAGVVGTTSGWRDAYLARKHEAEQRRGAEIARDVAEKQRQLALETSVQLEHQLRQSTVDRLVAQSQAMRVHAPIQSLLLGMEAVSTTQQFDGTVRPNAHQNILSATAILGGQPLVGHKETVKSLAISPDGDWVVTGDDAGVARIWRTGSEHTGDASLELREHTGPIHAITIGRSGRWLVTASGDDTARVWRMENGRPTSPAIILYGHDGDVLCSAISPDGRWLATGSRDSTARLWDLTSDDPATGSIILPGHEDAVQSLAFSPDSRWLFTCSWDKTARSYDLLSSDPSSATHVFQGHNHYVWDIAVSNDGKWLVTGSWDATARIWDLTADDPTTACRVLPDHLGAVSAVTFTPDSRWLITTWHYQVRLWDLADDDPALSPRILHGHTDRVVTLAVSADSRRLVTGSRDHTARVWDLLDEDPNGSSLVLRGHDRWVESVAVSRDGEWIVTGGSDNTPRLHHVDRERPSSSVFAFHHGRPVTATGMSPDGGWLFTIGYKEILMWDLTADSRQSAWRMMGPERFFENGIWSFAVSSDSRWLATGHNNGQIDVWDLTHEGSNATRLTLEGHSKRVTAIAFSPDSRHLATGSLDSTVRLWEISSDTRPFPNHVLTRHDGGVHVLAFSQDGSRLVTGGDDAIARVWDYRELGSSFTALEGHENSVQSVKISPDGRWVGTQGGTWQSAGDRTTRVWDLQAEDPSASSTVVSSGLPIVFDPAGRWLAARHDDHTVRLFELAPGDFTVPASVLEHTVAISSFTISPNGQWLAARSSDKTAVLWDLSTEHLVSSKRVLRGHSGVLQAIEFDSTGRYLLTGSRDSTVRIWDLDTDGLVEKCQAVAGRSLTSAERQQFGLQP